MTRNELNDQYFEWMYQLVLNERYSKSRSYRKLISYLNDISFRFSLPMDDNRSADGIDLRYRFGYEKSYDNRIIAQLLDDHPCSVLEMMIALSMRCEENIMANPEVGNRLGQWFWDMLRNLGLIRMDDEHFDQDYVRYRINRMLDREYESNGEGGLFVVKNARRDLRSVEIWYQACWYLDEVLEEGE
jgi:hypothetical protein